MNSDNLNNDSEISALKNQVFTLLVALVVISGTFMVYLYREASMAGKDQDQLTAMSQAALPNEQAIGNFLGNLVAYGSKHPDFVPILKKYGLTQQPGTAPAPGK